MRHKYDAPFNAKLYGKEKFSFRKLSVGLCAVALGTVFYLGNAQLVHAGTNQDSTQPQQSEVIKSDTSTKDQNQINNNSSSLTVSKLEDNDASLSAATSKEEKIPVKSGTTHPVVLAKKQNHESASTSAKLLSDDGSADDANGKQVMAKNDNIEVNVHYENTNLQAGQKFKVTFSDSSKWTVNGWESGTSKSLSDLFTAVNNGDGSFTITSNSNNETDSSFDLDFALQYADQVAANTSAKLTVTLNHDDDHNKDTITSGTYNLTVTPYKDTVQKDEIAHGWASMQNPPKSVDNNDDGTKDLLNGTSAVGHDRKLMQYMVEWNYGKAGNTATTTLSPLDTANFTARFSEGQTLLPDTIKVFRVYQPDAVNSDGSRKDITDTYSDITKQDSSGNYLYEDKAFEQFLRDHLTVTDGSGKTTNLSYSDYEKELATAKQNGTEPPLVNGIHLDESDMSKVKLSDGSTHDFSVNVGDNTDKTQSSPHSTFFIQMDTLLNANMPSDWTIPGHGPSIIYNPVSGDFNGVGTKISKSTSTIFNGGKGWSHENSYSATLHFADVTDKNNIISLDTGHGVAVLNGVDEDSAAGTTIIHFANVEDAIKILASKGYKLVGGSYGTKINGSYTDLNSHNDLYNGSDASQISYGTYGDEYANQISENSWTQSFTLNFVHATETETQTATVTENVYGYYENGDKLQNFDGIDDPDSAVPQSDQTISSTDLDPNHTVTVTYSRSRTVDLVDSQNNTKWTEWTVTSSSKNKDIPAILYNNTTIKNELPDYYYLDKNGVVHITGQQDGFKVAVKPNSGISEVTPSSDFLAAIASTTTVKDNKTTTTKGKTAVLNIWVPYHQEKPVTPPVNPTNPSNPTEPTKPTQPSKPVQPTKPQKPNKPNKPNHPNKPNKRKPRKPNKPWNYNNPPRSERNPHGKHNGWNNNFGPHGENNNMPVHPSSLNGFNENYLVHGTSLSTNNSQTGQNSIRNNAKTLPQTGAKQSKLGILGLALAAFAALLEAASDRKRKNN